MMGITMLIANFIYVYGVGIVPAASKVPVDIITKRNQEKYKTPGSFGLCVYGVGHGRLWKESIQDIP